MPENRRAFERFGTDMVFWIKPLGAPEDVDYQPMHIKNISGGGISCATNAPFDKDAEVALSFELPQHTDLIEASGIVRHCGLQDDGHYDIGLQFTGVEGLPTSLLIDYLEELFK